MARTDSNLETPRPFFKRALKAIAQPIFLRQFDMFLPTGSRAVAYLRHYGVPDFRIGIVPYCIDVEAFAAAAARAGADRERLRAEFGATDEERLVLFAGKTYRSARHSDPH